MNINAMFLQKFIYEIVATACALNKNNAEINTFPGDDNGQRFS